MEARGRAWPPPDPPGGDYRRASLAGTRLVASLSVGGGPDRAVALARGGTDAAGWSVVPVVTQGAAGDPWQRARPGDGVAAGLVASMAAGDAARDGFRLDVTDARAFTDVSADERHVGVDQTNESVVVGERLAVKWLLHPDPARERAPRLLRHLAAAGFRELPPLAGTLAWQGEGMDAPMTLAIVDRWLPDATDGWEWCTDAVMVHAAPAHDRRVDRPAGFAADLGRLVARLHLALATPTSVIPSAVARVGREAVDAWTTAAHRTLQEAIALTVSDDAAAGTELRAAESVLRATIERLGAVRGATVQPTHGDLHVGQVLRGPHGLAVIDLDGNPTADAATLQAPAPAARDVAGMLCSLDHVGRIAIQRGAHEGIVDAWIDAARAAFLAAYREALAGAARGDLFDARLLAPFIVEQECRELIYAARVLPRWRYAPMGAIRAMVARR